MNYIKKLEAENKVYQEFIKEFNHHIHLSKFDWPNDYIQKGDVCNLLSNLWHRLSQVN